MKRKVISNIVRSLESKVGVVYSDIMLIHEDDKLYSHPESPSRVDYSFRHLRKIGMFDDDRCDLIEPRNAKVEELELFHSEEYISVIQSLDDPEILRKVQRGPWSLDTYFCQVFLRRKGTLEASFCSSGSVLTAVDKVIGSEEYDHVFCLNRPPGHHAMPSKAMGFCMFNNVAVGALYARNLLIEKGIENPRIGIFDFDVHHCNSTALLCDMVPEIVVVSTHYSGYPMTGSICDVGEYENLVNVEFNYSYGTSDLVCAFNEIVHPVLTSEELDFLFISAGFDCCLGDPVGGCQVDPKIFGWMVGELIRSGKNDINNIVMVLEGGYDLTNLSVGIEYCIRGLMLEEWDDATQASEEPSRKCKSIIDTVKSIHSNRF